MKRLTMVTLALALAATVGPLAAGTYGHNATQSQKIDETAMAGHYGVTLEVLPAETFTGSHPEMKWDGGAKPLHDRNVVEPPNHHMVVFVKRDGKPVEDATVALRYRIITDNGMSQWKDVPVARMHEAGKGLDTTHYGNNIDLPPGQYEVKAKVNGRRAEFHFTLASS